jgi:hypothetical protein
VACGALRATVTAGRRWCWDRSIRSIPPAPGWMRPHAVHATRPVHVRGEIRTGYTCNVLIDRARPEIRGLRFDPALGRSGGEDSDYFARVVLMGGRISYAPDALVTEPVAGERLSFLAGTAALPDGRDPCGRLMRRHGVPPWRAVPRGHGQGRGLRLPCARLRGPSRTARRGASRGCFMPAWWPVLVGRRAPVLYGGTSPIGGPMNPVPVTAVASARISCPTAPPIARRRRWRSFCRAAPDLGDDDRAPYRHRRGPVPLRHQPQDVRGLRHASDRGTARRAGAGDFRALPTSRNDTSMLNEMQILASLQVASDVVTTLV